MIARESSGQSLIVFQEPVCSVCPHGSRGRCRGPSTVESVVNCGERRIGCTDAERITRFYLNLAKHLPARAQHPPTVPDLPAFIPVLEAGLPAELNLRSGTLYAVTLGRLLKRNGGIRYSSPEKLRKALRLNHGNRLCLVGTCQEDKLELLWEKSKTCGIWEQIQKLGFEFVTTSTFAVWPNQARSDQINAQDRNAGVYEIMTGLGVPTIPLFFCGAEEDYQEAAEWIDARPDIEIVSSLAQYYRDPSAFSRYFEKLCRFRDSMPRPLHYLIVGCGTNEKIRMVFSEFPRATIVSSKPVRLGRSGRRVFPSDLHFVSAMRDVSHEELINGNIRSFEEFCSRLSCPGIKSESDVSTLVPVH